MVRVLFHNYTKGINSLMPEHVILYPVLGRYSQKQIFIDSSHLTWNKSFSCRNKARPFHPFVLRCKATDSQFMSVARQMSIFCDSELLCKGVWVIFLSLNVNFCDLLKSIPKACTITNLAQTPDAGERTLLPHFTEVRTTPWNTRIRSDGSGMLLKYIYNEYDVQNSYYLSQVHRKVGF